VQVVPPQRQQKVIQGQILCLIVSPQQVAVVVVFIPVMQGRKTVSLVVAAVAAHDQQWVQVLVAQLLLLVKAVLAVIQRLPMAPGVARVAVAQVQLVRITQVLLLVVMVGLVQHQALRAVALQEVVAAAVVVMEELVVQAAPEVVVTVNLELVVLVLRQVQSIKAVVVVRLQPGQLVVLAVLV
tara:strand:+ start:290 stop:838 length:549 start_codon:yes stop_codon:yes gene_type:complete